MGEYLSKPEKTKHTESGESQQASSHLFRIQFRFDLLQQECKGGEDQWKTLILRIPT